MEQLSGSSEEKSANLPYPICTHIKDDGIRCGTPALKGQNYCKFHIRMHDDRASLDDPSYTLPILETEQSVQIALQQMMAGVLSGKLSERKAAIMLSGIKAAASLIRQARDNKPKGDLLREIASEITTRSLLGPAPKRAPEAVSAFESGGGESSLVG